MDPYCWGTAWALILVLAVRLGLAQTDEDEKRPYKFAFAIEGYQHRSEEKDERGIIMGEFGFVTGDGVYHVTVYATDENGNFKILKMKNYYVGLPGEGTTAAPTRAPPPPPRTAAPPTAPTPSTTRSPILQHLDGLMGCGSCVVPNKNGKTPGAVGQPRPSSVSGEGLKDERFHADGPGSPANPAGGGKPSYIRPFGGGLSRQPGGPSGVPGGNVGPGAQPGRPTTGLTAPSRPTSGTVGGTSQYSPQSPGVIGSQRPNSGIPGQSIPGGDKFNQNINKPETEKFGKDFPKPGQISTGLPPGMSIAELMELLYKFNYTLKFHGHHESGYRNGDKEGAYFFNGRDGLGRNVEYIANEFGFQPNITLVDLGLKSPDTPQGGEDELSNELKGYEFKWFYSK